MDQAPVLTTAADPAAEPFRANEAAHRALGEELRAKLAAARLGGGEKAQGRHTARGKLLPRDRVDTLLDPGSPFLELAPLAAEGMYGGQAPAAGVPVPGGLRRRLPAHAGRGLPGPRALRPDLLQPGPDVGRGHPAGRGGP